AQKERAPAESAAPVLVDQAGYSSLQPVSAGVGMKSLACTTWSTTNRSSGSAAPLSTAWPMNTDGVSWWSSLRYITSPGCSATSGGSLKPSRPWASLTASSDLFSLATRAQVQIAA